MALDYLAGPKREERLVSLVIEYYVYSVLVELTLANSTPTDLESSTRTLPCFVSMMESAIFNLGGVVVNSFELRCICKEASELGA